MVTLKPFTIAETSQNISPLITSVNSPKVRIFIGKVKSIRIGLIRELTNAKTTATRSAVKKLSTDTPGTI